MRHNIVAGNWKMNKTLEEAKALTLEIVRLVSEINNKAKVVLCTPYPYLVPVKELLGDHKQINVAAQNCSEHESGAYTGEVSAAMLKAMGIPYVILGHSERRLYFGEDGKLLAKKIDKALEHHLSPIFCCGEPLEIREKGTHEALV